MGNPVFASETNRLKTFLPVSFDIFLCGQRTSSDEDIRCLEDAVLVIAFQRVDIPVIRYARITGVFRRPQPDADQLRSDILRGETLLFFIPDIRDGAAEQTELLDLHQKRHQIRSYRRFLYAKIRGGEILVLVVQTEPSEKSNHTLSLSEIRKGKETEQNLMWLSTNLDSFYKNRKSCKECKYMKSLEKLHDHVSLDVARLSYIDNITVQQDRMAKTSLDLAINAGEKAQKAQEKLNKAQRDYIAILGIFAAIMTAAVGSFSFSTGVFSSVDKIGYLPRLIGITTILGVVFVCIMDILSKIVFRMNETTEDWKSIVIYVSAILLVGLIMYFVSLYWH